VKDGFWRRRPLLRRDAIGQSFAASHQISSITVEFGFWALLLVCETGKAAVGAGPLEPREPLSATHGGASFGPMELAIGALFAYQRDGLIPESTAAMRLEGRRKAMLDANYVEPPAELGLQRWSAIERGVCQAPVGSAVVEVEAPSGQRFYGKYLTNQPISPPEVMASLAADLCETPARHHRSLPPALQASYKDGAHSLSSGEASWNASAFGRPPLAMGAFPEAGMQ
jgi:hypothetical protein